MKVFSKDQMRRIMGAFEDYVEGWTVLQGDDLRRHRRVFAALVTRKQPAPWRESASREKHRKLPLK